MTNLIQYVHYVMTKFHNVTNVPIQLVFVKNVVQDIILI